jgi:hypothetical protein
MQFYQFFKIILHSKTSPFLKGSFRAIFINYMWSPQNSFNFNIVYINNTCNKHIHEL